MKRSLAALFALLLPAAVFAATPTTHSYLIGTRHPAREALGRIARGEGAVTAGRNVDTYDIVDAYRADLTEDEANALRKSPEVRYVEQDAPRHALGFKTSPTAFRSPTGQTVPYGIDMVKARALWPVTKGAGINVAVLDTGIDPNHPDLQSAYAGGFNAYYTSNSANETPVPVDDFGHGTHVSGTIAATDNDIGVVGVAPNVHLWMVRVLKNDGQGGATGSSATIISGMNWVMQQKQKLGGDWIVSMSLGSCTSVISEQNAVANAINAGILVVAASGNHDSSQADTCSTGNDNSYEVNYPAAYPGVIAVAAVDSTGTVADFSNTGPEVSLSAPGVDVLSTVPLGTGSISYVTTSSGKLLNSVAITGSPFGTLNGKFINCGFGATANDFPQSVNGNIALIKRGTADPNTPVTFATKVKNAQTAGATAVIIYNKDDSPLAFRLTGDPADAGHVWPLTLAVSLEDGLALLANPPTTVTLNALKDDYDTEQGTSMATPHVSGVAALVWSTKPTATAADVKQALISTAHDLGTPGVDNSYGYGFIDAVAAAERLSGISILNGGVKLTPPYSGRAPGRRGR